MKTHLFITSIVLFVFLHSCKKYPDGPGISLFPRTERIEGKWMAESVKYNDIDSTSAYSGYIWEFTRNNSVILQIHDKKKTGIWSMVTNNKDFRIDYDDGKTELYEIRKLMRKEFWLRNKTSQLDFQLVLK